MKRRHFGSLFFLKLIYMIDNVYNFISIWRKNVQNNYLMGLIFSTSWRVATMKIEFYMGIWFFKKHFESHGFHVVVWSQNVRFSYFSFGLIFQRILAKKRLVLHILCPSHPCASLARTVLEPLSFLAGTL